MESTPGRDLTAWRRALLVIGAAAVVRLLFAALIPLFPDETYYWEWSRHLAPGYFDHPGGVALLVRLGTIAFSPFGAAKTALGVRFAIILAGWIAALATVATARRIGGDRAALRAAIVISVLPLAAAGLILATPDVPVLAATAIGLYCVVRALQETPRSASSLRWWIATGVALGLAFSSKYTSIFLPVGVVLAILMRRDLRARLGEPGPYVACVIATIVFLPVLLWNSQHDWISFVFQLRHGLAKPEGSALRAAWRHEGDFWGGQAGLASPILFVMFGIAAWRALRGEPNRERFVLAVVAGVSFGFFVYSAIRQRVEPNWPAPAYIPAVVLLATTSWGRAGERWLRAGMWFAGVMSAIIYVQGVMPVLPLKPAKDPIARAFGWRELTASVDSTATVVDRETGHRAWLGGDRYQEASELAFHSSSQDTTFATNLTGRVNQYDLWPRFPDVATPGDNLVLALDESDGPHDAVKALMPYFSEARRGALVTMRRGTGEIARRRIWVLLGFRGGWPAVR